MSYRDYVFSLLGAAEGAPAPNWKAALESLPGRGMGINPQPGEVQLPNAPHHGVTVMIDAGGNARGRIWLPSDVPVMHEGNAWFTHEIQVIADGPEPGSFVWAWIDKGGAPVRPFDAATAPPPAPAVPPSAPPVPPAPALDVDAVLIVFNEILTERFRELDERLAALGAIAARPWPEYSLTLPRVLGGATVTLRPK